MKKIIAVCVFAGVIITVGLVICVLLPREPLYQGKTISQWIMELPVGQRPTAWGGLDPETPARKVLLDLGTNAIPHLVRALNENTKGVLTEFRIKLWYMSPVLQSRFPRPAYPSEIRRAAAGVLVEIIARNAHNGFEEVVPALSTLVHDRGDPRITAIGALGILAVKRGSQSALSQLILALDSPDEAVRSHAAWKLSDGGPAQSQALPALARRLSDPSDAVRINAALAVYRIGGRTNEAVSALIGALRSKVPTHRGNAAYHLSLIGPPAKPAVPALEELLQDPDPYSRQGAAAALRKIDPENHNSAY